METLLLGLSAGFALSPHNLKLLLVARFEGALQGLYFSLGALFYDLLLVGCLLLFQDAFQGVLQYQSLFYFAGAMYFTRLFTKVVFAKPDVGPSNGPRTETPLWSGFLVQAINPNAYLFWATIGLLKISQDSSFVVPFLLIVYGIKVLLLNVLVSRLFQTQPFSQQAIRLLNGTLFLFLSVFYHFRGFAEGFSV